MDLCMHKFNKWMSSYMQDEQTCKFGASWAHLLPEECIKRERKAQHGEKQESKEPAYVWQYDGHGIDEKILRGIKDSGEVMNLTP